MVVGDRVSRSRDNCRSTLCNHNVYYLINKLIIYLNNNNNKLAFRNNIKKCFLHNFLKYLKTVIFSILF